MNKCWMLMLSGLCVCLLWGAMVDAAPKIEFVEGAEFNFGMVQPNASLNHVFVFKNTGDEVLRIDSVKGG